MIRKLLLGLVLASAASNLASAQFTSVSCEPGTLGVINCPCSNPPSGLGRGCNNSLNTGGASLTATGTPLLSADNIQFNCTNIGTATASCSGSNTNVLCRLYEGTNANPTGAFYGDGVICCTGPFYILHQGLSTAGVFHWPVPGTTGVSTKAISLGDPLVVGSTRFYFVVYRDTCASFCPGSVRQKSNSWTLIWGP